MSSTRSFANRTAFGLSVSAIKRQAVYHFRFNDTCRTALKYRLEITEPAERDIRSAYAWWSHQRSAEQAERWYESIYKAIDKLRSVPLRCPSAPETDLHPPDLRQLLFGIGRRPTHRIVFTIEEDTVVVLRVRHTSQQDLEAGDLP